MAAQRVAGLGTSIFTEMTALAQRTGAVNLGQGFPDEDGPPAVVEAAAAALRAGHNQYAPGRGVPALREAVAAHQARAYGLQVDPETEVLVTFGATEALAAALLGLCDPGDEVVVFEPYYDSYAAAIGFAGGKRRPVTLRAPDFAIDGDALRAAIGPRTRLLLLNSPHNPTGRVLSRAELEAVAAVCVEHDLVAITDEVYEHLVFDGEHVPLATLPGMAERTLTISSLGKTFSLTGWKVGWATGPAELVSAAAGAKQFLSFSGGTPFQHAAAHALTHGWEAVQALVASLRARRDLLCAGLEAAGFGVVRPAGTYFVCADVRPLGEQDGVAFCLALPERAGVVAIPCAAFHDDAEAGRPWVRFAFCKREAVLEEGLARLARMRAPTR
ncbi:MAG TPA: pyridoxal phosphate-dependent aminotransferase [Solirubrobacteraceae bacterium]